MLFLMHSRMPTTSRTLSNALYSISNMPPKPTKADDSPQDLSTATLLECLVDHTKKHDDMLALLTEALLKLLE
ncbi:hypothetical protein C343_01194 [Cryptococcus neoformans C23]|uniref:Uncharacterized protein n=1 Tax=Cryptococcus neoformans (strain H99 / ATCC 208821 / CBS 10515 / FGSC 9487) TaxID=235443 RepID=J9VNN3_CRYN9|nr:hypothetical protein CNAG_03798 [Cryptococcus neoformans var. grubii H99]AFR93305.1 hypothetical protein CNAG_03798 [Cryptococcus neoformans var. grubii H99]AUB22828.1 hypothetical protein CKF44_03798 [Cryptococcus neoformans var. grubii]OWZ47128.1 hypothetical protein C343_01194 [Cryptococcus neoformans var. grubii C23]OXH37742.1 hypothetical protein J005_01203 [Cryptococcus neoformans var. grubii]|eukprot:XP_012047462.1 hypothetical protein CNAG_03798 [Cryptococcus neoformans var. grubii H99]